MDIHALILPSIVLLVTCVAFWYHRRTLTQFIVREKSLLRTLRMQEDAHQQLGQAHRILEQRARQLAQSNAELERFAHVASHDLKEPVRTVVSFTQLLARKYSGSLDAQGQEYIRGAADAARSIRSRIESLLDFALVGEGDEEPLRTDCRAALEKAMTNLKPALSDSGAQIHCEALPTVLAHSPEVVLLFQNLLDNAIKFRGPDSPEVHISAQRAETPSQWQLCVQDNGIGVDPRSSPKMFELFERLHSQADTHGMGMGLAVCRKIVTRHGGRIWHEPVREGSGSRFLFTLPAPIAA